MKNEPNINSNNNNDNIKILIEKVNSIEERVKKLEEENKILKEKNEKFLNIINILKTDNRNLQESIDLLKQDILYLNTKEEKEEEKSKDKNKLMNNIITLSEHSDSVFQVSSFPSGNYVSISWDKSIKIFNENNKLIQSINNAHDDSIYYVSVKDENNFSTCSFDNSIKLWERKNNNLFELKETILKAHSKTIYKIIYNSKGNIYSCSMDKTIKIWEKRDKNYICLNTLNHTVFVNAILLLEDYNYIISAGWDGTYIWDLNIYNLVIKIKNAISLSSNSLNRIDNDRIIVGGGNDHIMKIISLKKKQIVLEVDNIFRCYCVLIIKDKNIFFTGGMSNNIKIYSLSDFNCLYIEENAHNDTINGISRINDEKIITFSWDKTIKIWEINYNQLKQ